MRFVVVVLGAWLLATPSAAQSSLGEARRVPAAAEFGNFTLFDAPRPVPEVRFTDGQEQPHSLGEFRGQVLLLNLWATWCAPCRREMPALDRLQAALGGAHFQVLALAVDRGGIDKVRAFLVELEIRHLTPYLDRSTRALPILGAFGLPTTLLIDKAGNEIGRVVGPAEWDSAEAFELIRRVIAEPERGPRRARAPAATPRS